MWRIDKNKSGNKQTKKGPNRLVISFAVLFILMEGTCMIVKDHWDDVLFFLNSDFLIHQLKGTMKLLLNYIYVW